ARARSGNRLDSQSNSSQTWRATLPAPSCRSRNAACQASSRPRRRGSPSGSCYPPLAELHPGLNVGTALGNLGMEPAFAFVAAVLLGEPEEEVVEGVGHAVFFPAVSLRTIRCRKSMTAPSKHSRIHQRARSLLKASASANQAWNSIIRSSAWPGVRAA